MNESKLSEVFSELSALLGDRATTSLAQREHHSKGESHHPGALPDIVCFPHTTEEVSAIAKISTAHQVPIIPFGAGTSLEGHVVALHGGITIDLREMNKVLRVSVEDLDATVQAGITRLAVVKALRNTGVTFFIDPGSDPTIGGMASTRASGTAAVLYGTMRENVLGLTVVLADGTVIHTGSRARKSSAGYDLTHLFIGAEGTLGIITEVTLRLHILPGAVAAAICSFPTIQAAVETAMAVIQFGIRVARIEFMDERQVDAINRYSQTELPVLPTLLFEFHGMNERDVADQAEQCQEIAQEHGGLGFVWKKTPEDREALWKARHNAYHAALALRPGAKGLTTDACIPISRLAECIVETAADLATASFPTTIVGHVGDGNFHCLCILDETNPDEIHEAEAISGRIAKRALAMGGTCTGEHGIGYGKMKYMQAEHGAALDVMRAIKQALDPDNRMNPGKMIPAAE